MIGAHHAGLRPIITAGLVGRWFVGDQSYSDRSGNGRNLSGDNSPTWTKNPSGQLLTLNGTNQYASRSSIDFGLNGLTECSVCVTFKTSDSSGRIIQKESYISSSTFDMTVAGGLLTFLVQNVVFSPDQYPYWVTKARVDDDVLHRVCCTFKKNAINSTDCVIVLDGNIATTTYNSGYYASNFVLAENTNNLVVGAQIATYVDLLAGQIGDIRVYNRKLALQEAIAYTRGQG